MRAEEYHQRASKLIAAVSDGLFLEENEDLLYRLEGALRTPAPLFFPREDTSSVVAELEDFKKITVSSRVHILPERSVEAAESVVPKSLVEYYNERARARVKEIDDFNLREALRFLTDKKAPDCKD